MNLFKITLLALTLCSCATSTKKEFFVQDGSEVSSIKVFHCQINHYTEEDTGKKADRKRCYMDDLNQREAQKVIGVIENTKGATPVSAETSKAIFGEKVEK